MNSSRREMVASVAAAHAPTILYDAQRCPSQTCHMRSTAPLTRSARRRISQTHRQRAGHVTLSQRPPTGRNPFRHPMTGEFATQTCNNANLTPVSDRLHYDCTHPRTMALHSPAWPTRSKPESHHADTPPPKTQQQPAVTSGSPSAVAAPSTDLANTRQRPLQMPSQLPGYCRCSLRHRVPLLRENPSFGPSALVRPPSARRSSARS